MSDHVALSGDQVKQRCPLPLRTLLAAADSGADALDRGPKDCINIGALLSWGPKRPLNMVYSI